MITLNIEDFSCIRSARFQLAPVTVLIGPQGSGKSVTTKLCYFFCDLLIRQYSCAEKGLSLEDFKKDAARQFRTWFPPSAWGKRRSNINFSAGQFSVRVLRRTSRGAVADDVAVSFSDFFNVQYENLIIAFDEYRSADVPDDTRALRRSMEAGWKLREESERRLAAALHGSFVRSQTFIPAGRAFFTSIGRLVAAFEQGSSLDPVTVRFAKLFANVRDIQGRRQRLFQTRASDTERELAQSRKKVMNRLFGGEIKFENELEYVETRDGRKVPFAALSSGQQELLPMWLLVELMAENGPTSDSLGRECIYIEEPEAHLFPAAQSLLMDFLIGRLRSRNERSLVLTSHSPYILAKLNNYLKAGYIGKNKKNAAAVSEIVPRECWLTPDDVKAYAIEDGYFRDLMTEDGLIDGSYIDEISEEVSSIFSALLDIQYPETAA